MHAASPFLDLENCRTFGCPVANCRIILPRQLSRDLVHTDFDFLITRARGQVNKLKGKKKGEYHIYEQFRRSQKKIEYQPQEGIVVPSLLFLFAHRALNGYQALCDGSQSLILCLLFSFAAKDNQRGNLLRSFFAATSSPVCGTVAVCPYRPLASLSLPSALFLHQSCRTLLLFPRPIMHLPYEETRLSATDEDVVDGNVD
jgi:hypothetical protein